MEKPETQAEQQVREAKMQADFEKSEAEAQKAVEAQFEKAENRFLCRKCKAQYRLESDAREHSRLGCKAKSAKKNSKSLKDEPAE